MWRNLRIAILLLILGIAAWCNWYDRLSTTDWDEMLYIGIFPIDETDNAVTREYIAGLSDASVADIEQFLNREARRYGIAIDASGQRRVVSAGRGKTAGRSRERQRAADHVVEPEIAHVCAPRGRARRAGRRRRSAFSCVYHDVSFTRSRAAFGGHAERPGRRGTRVCGSPR